MRKGFGSLWTRPKALRLGKQRAARMAESLMLAMEGEEEVPPPILRAAFLRQPRAQEGWNAMTPTQRRNHLLGIFYVQTVEGREKRAGKAVEEALPWRGEPMASPSKRVPGNRFRCLMKPNLSPKAPFFVCKTDF